MENSMENSMENAKDLILKFIEHNTFIKFLGIEFVEITKDHAVGKMPFKPELLNPYNTIHGGALYSFADIVAGCFADAEGYLVTTVSGTLSFLSGARNTEYVYCEAIKLHYGSHLATYQVKITDDNGKLLDNGEFTFFVTNHKLGEEK